jgi:hypothetical protein
MVANAPVLVAIQSVPGSWLAEPTAVRNPHGSDTLGEYPLAPTGSIEPANAQLLRGLQLRFEPDPLPRAVPERA